MGLFKRVKIPANHYLAMLLELIPEWILLGSIKKYHADKGFHKNRTYDQPEALTFG
jgi:hypothetical protein